MPLMPRTVEKSRVFSSCYSHLYTVCGWGCPGLTVGKDSQLTPTRTSLWWVGAPRAQKYLPFLGGDWRPVKVMPQ